jgi:hypothetical protein
VDAYLSEITRDLTGSTDKLDRLLPGQAREISLQQVATGSSVEVIAVVLQDGTALGDVRTIQSIFERRQMERDDLRAVSDIFGAVLPSTTGIPAFEELKRRFANPPQRSESTPMRSARDAVDAYLKVITLDNADALTQQLRSYADLVQCQYELAVRHSEQKKPLIVHATQSRPRPQRSRSIPSGMKCCLCGLRVDRDLVVIRRIQST